MAIIKSSQYKEMPWKNGGGRTAEIDRVPQTERYLWRVSSATVSVDGEFSLFPGFERLLVVIRGPGLWLNETKLEPLKPFRFPGEQPINCRLIGGEVRDLGLIFDREKVRAEMICISEERPKPAKDLLASYIFDLDSGNTYKDVAVCPVKRGILISVADTRI